MADSEIAKLVGRAATVLRLRHFKAAPRFQDAAGEVVAAILPGGFDTAVERAFLSMDEDMAAARAVGGLVDGRQAMHRAICAYHDLGSADDERA